MAVTIDGSAGVTTNAGGSVNPSTNVEGINYSCRAWVNFDGTGTVAIRASGNVSSITDNGTGNYTANFTTAMTDANYATVGITEGVTGTNTTNLSVYDNVTSQTTSSVRVTSVNNSNLAADRSCISVSVFR